MHVVKGSTKNAALSSALDIALSVPDQKTYLMFPRCLQSNQKAVEGDLQLLVFS